MNVLGVPSYRIVKWRERKVINDMEPTRDTYLVTYSFDVSHGDIRDDFRTWLKEGEFKAQFCDESTYGFSTDDSVSVVTQKMVEKLKELYGCMQPHNDDIVNLFCSSIQTNYNIRRDSSLSYLLHKIDQHHILYQCIFS